MRQSAWDELCRLLIRGATQKQAAELLGFHVQTIKKWVANAEFKLKLQRTRALIFEKTKDVVASEVKAITEDVVALRENLAVKGLKTIGTIMDDKKTATGIKLKAAIELADRGTDTSKTKKIQQAHLHALITPENLMVASKAAQEMLEDFAVGRHVEAIELEPSLALPLEDVDVDGD